MTTPDGRIGTKRARALQDSDMETVRLNRRSFLARAAGAGTLAVGAVVSAACGDQCDSDTVTDNDGGRFADPLDRARDRTCDRDDY